MNKKLIERIIKEKAEGKIGDEIINKLISEGWGKKESHYSYILSDIMTLSPDCEKLISKVTFAGTATVTLGSTLILLPTLLYIAELFNPNLYSGSHALPKLNIIYLLFSILLGIIYMILGKRIESGIDINQKRYIHILSIVSLLLLFTGAGSIFFIVALVNLLIAWLAENKLFKIDAFREHLIAPEYQMKKIHWILIIAAGISLAIISIYVSR